MARSTDKSTGFDPSAHTLAELCGMVVGMMHPYEDLAESIEDKAYAECEHDGFEEAKEQIRGIAAFFEQLENKSEENSRDLADVYVLLGEMHQCARLFRESEEWFEKAIVADDTYHAPYHSLAHSYLRRGEEKKAIKCWEQEIHVAPGNYYTYLLLADVYEKRGDANGFVRVLEGLLERDPDNIRALHRLIRHHERRNPELNVELLRRRLIGADSEFVKAELVIWTYHMCREKRFEEALWFLERREKDSLGLTVTHLLKAYIFGRLRHYTRKRRELSEFKCLSHGNENLMRTKLDEFRSVFGERATDRLAARLFVARPAG
ncbi:MAG: hypothetical protein GF418_15455 [Chitinivibrionales bacterium]|nr:hypothetical protein [Chitinivibrionales bacterium]MBD3397018.1 hypothetical protein [Chitinivibrionales bacterium]